MTAPSVSVTRTTTLEPARDSRLFAYVVVAFGLLAAAVLTGEAGLVALAAPFSLALALGLRRNGPVEIDARMVLESGRVLEGDVVSGTLELSWEGDFDAEVLIHRLKGVTVTSENELTRWSPNARQVRLPVRFEASQWGRHQLGEVWLRLTVPFGLLSWTGKLMMGPPLSVLPGGEKLNQLLRPSESRASWGVHGSSRVGDGHDFAELRHYQPGDRLRDLNWAATARHRRPYVNRHHPELAGDVVIALDAYDDGSALSTKVLTRMARVAWALASVHFRSYDRVGLVGLSGSTQWLPPVGGRFAQYKLMDVLLQIGGDAADQTTVSPRSVDIPSAALVIALTSLHNQRSVDLLAWWRSRGRAVAVVMIDPTTLLDLPKTEADQLARRVWRLELERRVADLRGFGVPVVPAPVDGAIAPALSALRRARRSTFLRRT